MPDSITIRESTENNVGVMITDHERDLSDTVVNAYAIETYTGERVKVASSSGAAEGENFFMDVSTTLLEPGVYDLEIVAGGRLVYPNGPQKRKLTLKIINTNFND
jgi:hypothetical protein